MMGSTPVQKGLLALCILLILGGLGLTIAGVFSPAWQVVDIREFRAEHQVSFYKFVYERFAPRIIKTHYDGNVPVYTRIRVYAITSGRLRLEALLAINL
ncbi:unnamed protein product [Gongylonema pulchrum]|uniref:DUF3592 domain-containing protein n=1 Tax=Gongylonema pulchrum TaxID=637853 RepID=A0A183CWY3_9BILA|nr:unnamed protein product [Gongylonema pulchrum]